MVSIFPDSDKELILWALLSFILFPTEHINK